MNFGVTHTRLEIEANWFNKMPKRVVACILKLFALGLLEVRMQIRVIKDV